MKCLQKHWVTISASCLFLWVICYQFNLRKSSNLDFDRPEVALGKSSAQRAKGNRTNLAREPLPQNDNAIPIAGMLDEYKRLSEMPARSIFHEQRAFELLQSIAVKSPDRLFELIDSGIVAGSQILGDNYLPLLHIVAEEHPEYLRDWIANHVDSKDEKSKGLLIDGLRAYVTSSDSLKCVSTINFVLGGKWRPQMECIVVSLLGNPNLSENDVVELVKSFDTTNQGKDLMNLEIARIVASRNPVLAVELLASVQTGLDSRSSFGAAMASIFQVAPDLALSSIASLDVRAVGALIDDPRVLDILKSSGNIQAAEALFNRGVITESNSQSLSTLIVIIEKGNPSKAALISLAMTDSKYKAETLASLVVSRQNNNSSSLMEGIENLPDDLRNTAFRKVAQGMATANFDDAMALVASTTPSDQAVLYKEIGRAVAYSNPNNAIKILTDPALSEVIGNDFRGQMLDNTVQTWAKKDLSAARIWVESLAPLDAPKGYQGLMTPWMKSDPVAASDWLSKQPSGPARDAGAAVIIQQIKDTDPEMAEKWRESISTQPKKSK